MHSTKLLTRPQIDTFLSNAVPAGYERCKYYQLILSTLNIDVSNFPAFVDAACVCDRFEITFYYGVDFPANVEELIDHEQFSHIEPSPLVEYLATMVFDIPQAHQPGWRAIQRYDPTQPTTIKIRQCHLQFFLERSTALAFTEPPRKRQTRTGTK